jgi:Protein of unknown function (DUF2844)
MIARVAPREAAGPGRGKRCSQHPGVSMQTALVVVFWGVWLGAGPAWATLGQSVASVHTDQQALQAHRRTITHDGYEVEHLEAADGTVVREYVSPAGLVFGLAWQGPTVPDMTQLLGGCPRKNLSSWSDHSCCAGALRR